MAIREAALGVAACNTGLLINGRTIAVGAELLASLPLNGAMVDPFSEPTGEGREGDLEGGEELTVESGESIGVGVGLDLAVVIT